jgi:hypothetical protein
MCARAASGTARSSRIGIAEVEHHALIRSAWSGFWDGIVVVVLAVDDDARHDGRIGVGAAPASPRAGPEADGPRAFGAVVHDGPS